MRKSRLIAALGLLLFACDPIVKRVVTFTFEPTGERVTVNASTTLGGAKAGTPEFAEAEEERSALLAERDPWSLRFAQANPESDRVTFHRSHGKLESADRTATVATEQLQRFFFDTPITTTTTRGEGWMELAVYAGTSMRATAAQRRASEKILAAYSKRAARYFDSIRMMYDYLNEKPYRARVMFTDVFAEDDARLPLSEEEHSLTDAVRIAINTLVDTNDIDPSISVDRVFDLVYNPFPAQLRFIVKGQVLAVENFTKIENDTFEIKTLTALDAVAALEGRWITPDPLALALRVDDKKTPAEVAEMIESVPRRAEAVISQTEIATALVEKMKPAPRYRLRWTVRKGD